MKVNFPIFSRKTITLVITAAVLVGLLLLYKFYYVQNREAEIIAQKGRVLERIANNFIKKAEALSKVEENRVLSEKGEEFWEDSLKDLTFNNYGTYEKYINKINNQENFNLKIFNAIDVGNIYIDEYLFLFDDSIRLNKEDIQFFVSPENIINGIIDKEYSILSKSDFQSYYLYRITSDTSSELVYSSEVNRQVYIITDSTNVKYSPKFYNGTVQNVVAKGEPYKLMAVNFNSGGSQWNLVGLVDQAHFNQDTGLIPPIFITFYSLVIVLIFILLPQLQVVLLSKIEQLSLRNLIYFCISVISGFFIITLILTFTYDYRFGRVNREITKELIDKSNFVKEYSNESIEELYTKFENIYLLDTSILALDSNRNNAFPLYSAPFECKSSSADSSLVGILWINQNGEIKKSYTVSLDRPIETKINLAKREYFGEWNNTKRKDTLLFIQSIQSWTADKKSFIASKPYINQDQYAKVIAIEYECEAVFPIDARIPFGFNYYIIDSLGSILFSNDKKKNLQENLVTETDKDKNLIAAIKNPDSTKVFTINYHHNRYHAIVSKLGANFIGDKMPWRLVVTRDARLDSTPVMLSVTYTIYSLIVIVLAIIIAFLITSLANKKPRKLKHPKLDVDWLRPKDSNKEVYKKFIILNLIVIAGLVVYGLGNSNPIELLFCMIFTIYGLFIQLHIITQKAIYRLAFVLLNLIVIVSIYLIWLALSNQLKYVIIYSILFIFFSAVILRNEYFSIKDKITYIKVK